MDRRSFLASTTAAAAAIAAPPLAAAKALPMKTRWVVRGSEGFDALSFLSPLSGDPFYLEYYRREVAEFEPRMAPAAMAALKALKQRAEQANILLSPFLDLRFSAGPDSTIGDLLASAADADGRMLPNFRASPYWDKAEADRDWAQFKAALPALATILTGLKDAGFPAFCRNIVASNNVRFEQLRRKLAGFDVIRGAEFYTGRKFDPTIEIILLQFCKPHGIKVIGQRFLSALDWPDEVHIRTAGHEILHPPVDADGAANKAALAVLSRDPLLERVVKEHDPKFGYGSLEGLLDEDLASAVDQLIAERFGVARNARERWTEADGGMHILSAALYGLMKQDGFAGNGGNLEQWLLTKTRSGALAPRSLHAAAAQVLGRPADKLWPLQQPAKA
jgi:hypothetical protein